MVLFAVTVNSVVVDNDTIVCLFVLLPLPIFFILPVAVATTDGVGAVAVAAVAFTFVTVSTADVTNVAADIKTSSFTVQLNSSEDNCCLSNTVGTAAVVVSAATDAAAAAVAASTFVVANLRRVRCFLRPIQAYLPNPMVVVVFLITINHLFFNDCIVYYMIL